MMGVRFAEPDPDKDKGRWAKLWDLANDHKVFSGLAGAVLIAIASVTVALTVGNDDDGVTPDSSGLGPVAAAPAEPKADPDEDDDGVFDGEDQCPEEVGEESSGCPDSDGDGVPNHEDRCLEEAATTSNGCPAQPQVIGLLDYAEEYEHEFEATENAPREQVTVAGIIDPNGVRMQVGGAYRSAAFTVPVNRAFQWVQGHVGITSEPCSAGSVAYVEVRDAEGQPLWPKNGHSKTVHRDAVPFKVRITEEDSVVLYAEAPEAEGGYCGSSYGTTEVGWVNTELIAE